MRKTRRLFAALLLCAVLLGNVAYAAEPLQFTTAPHVLRPGKFYDIIVEAEGEGMASLQLLDESGTLVYTILDQYPISAGTNQMMWDGTRLDHSVIEQGKYTIRLTVDGMGQLDAPVRVGAPYPLITDILQMGSIIGGDDVSVAFNVSDTGTLDVKLMNYTDKSTVQLATQEVMKGPNVYRWDGLLDGERPAAGSYAVILTLRTATGAESMPQNIFIDIQGQEAEPDLDPVTEPVSTIFTDATPQQQAPSPTASPEPEPTPEPTPEAPLLSPPYSDLDDGTFWSMTPGELDDAVIWDILTQPITVYDDGKIGSTDHVYLRENPDGTGEKIAQIHGKSQGLHVLGEENEHGYILVEAFSNYDPDYNPSTEEDRASAFDVKQGYIKASGLKTVEVKQDMGFVIDKKTQRMYLYMDGKPVTEFLIATGRIEDNKYYNETIAGEYITISHTGGFWSGNMYCDMAIRINGGILLHEVPYKENADGTKNYSAFEGYLGTKQSHGCVRIQRLKTPEGYNHRWIWENLDRKGGYKVIIWDDDASRVDTPTTWQENPKN